MSYLVFARKYRPEKFSEVIGQEHITRTLRNSITRDRVGHAYLFSGPRGVGKTSIARIYAKALSCKNINQGEPCCECSNCLDIKNGRSLAVREIDGASHNSVENVRELIESFRTVPPPGSPYNIYIIDEVHMLSTQAFNALLKSLEEPPPRTVFILATTEPHKILDTVISRCQRFDFRAMSQEQTTKCIEAIVESEKIDIDSEVIRLLARLADGSMRDAQSLLERLRSFSEGRIDASAASLALGAVDRTFLERLVKVIFDRDSSMAIDLLDELNSKGFEPALFLKEFVAYWRELLIAKFGGQQALQRIGLREDAAKDLINLVSSAAAEDLQDLVKMARAGADRAIRSNYPFYAFESLIIQMTTRQPVAMIEDIVSGLRSFSKNIVSATNKVSTERASTSKSSTSKSSAEKVSTKNYQDINSKDSQESKKKDLPNSLSISSSEHEIGKAFRVEDLLKNIEKLNPEPILLLHLKRCEIVCEDSRSFTVKASDFSYKYFSEADRLDRLKTIFKEADEAGDLESEVEIKLVSVENNSIKATNKKAEAYTELEEHPKIKQLIKAFPGSQITKVSNL